MNRLRNCLPVLSVFLVLLLSAEPARAARVRIHYGPEALCGGGEHGPCPMPDDVRWFGLFKPPHSELPRPNRMVSFQHPCTGACVVVPLALPCGTPTIEHVYRRTVYNYGSYTVEVRFLPDGSVDVMYDSGLLRAL
jgi:hypothetical protein